jgi:hypothetical protein
MDDSSQPGALGSNEGLGLPGTRKVHLASGQRNPHGAPRFEVVNGGEAISDDDFIFDAWIKITGDFDAEEREAYAQWIADALNAADACLPRRA